MGHVIVARPNEIEFVRAQVDDSSLVFQRVDAEKSWYSGIFDDRHTDFSQQSRAICVADTDGKSDIFMCYARLVPNSVHF